MKIAIRVDASERMGTGHLVRCRTLADALRARGADVRFICREHPGNLIDELCADAFQVTALPPPTASNGEGEDYALWLGVPQTQDAAETQAALEGWRPDWLVVDHYGLDAQWERTLRSHAARMLAIDDLANRVHDCDLLLDQNYAVAGEGRYRGLVPTECRILLGPRYALLRPEYARYRKTLRPRDGPVRRVLIFFGGTDPHDFTGLALEALAVPALAHLEVDVVLGANNPHRERIAAETADRPRTCLHGPRPHLADLMAAADLAIGAGGATTWERLCLGLPSVVISIAENQRVACDALASAGLIRYLGSFDKVDAQRLAESIRALCDSPSQVQAMSQAGQLLVDGLGAERLAEALDPTPTGRLRIRPARFDDAIQLFNWVNDPLVRRESLSTAPIPWATHVTWFANRLADPNAHLFVMEADGLPVGQVRFERDGDEAGIHYSLDPLARGRGWGSELIQRGIAALGATRSVMFRAEVKSTNAPSCAVFLRLGFAETSSFDRVSETSGRVRVFRLPSSGSPAVG